MTYHKLHDRKMITVENSKVATDASKLTEVYNIDTYLL